MTDTVKYKGLDVLANGTAQPGGEAISDNFRTIADILEDPKGRQYGLCEALELIRFLLERIEIDGWHQKHPSFLLKPYFSA